MLMMDQRLLLDHAYALIDRVSGGTIPDGLPLIELAPAGMAHEAHLLPWLLPLRDVPAPQISELLDDMTAACAQGETPLLPTLMASPADVEAMRLHVVNRLIVRLADGQRVLLRYYDPRVFSQLRWILQPEQLVYLFGHIERWTFCLKGQWYSESRPQGANRLSLTPNAQQSAQLARIGAVNQVLATLLPHPTLAEHDRVSQAIDRLIERAQRQHGLAEEADWIAFARHGITVHPEFDRHPQIAAIIRRLPEDEATYRDATALLDEAHWQHIIHDLVKTDIRIAP